MKLSQDTIFPLVSDVILEWRIMKLEGTCCKHEGWIEAVLSLALQCTIREYRDFGEMWTELLFRAFFISFCTLRAILSSIHAMRYTFSVFTWCIWIWLTELLMNFVVSGTTTQWPPKPNFPLNNYGLGV